MSNNSNLDLNGLNPLSYLGVNPKTPVPFFSRAADPTPEDYDNFLLGTIWLNTENENIWMLASKSNRIAVWVQLSAGSSGTITNLTGNSGGLVMPLGGNINVVGDGTTINIVGNPATHTLTASLIGGGIATQSFITNSGTATPNGSGVLNVVGSGIVSTAGSGNTITITSSGGSGSVTITGDTGGSLTSSSFTFTGGTTGLSFDGSGTTETLDFAGITANRGVVNLGTDSTSNAINIGTVSSSGRVMTIGNDTGTTSMTLLVGTGSFDLTGVSSSNYTFGPLTTTGLITIGGAAQSGAISLGSSSATNIVGIGTGTGATTVNIATGSTNAKAVNIGTGAVANVVAIGSTTGAASLTLNSGSAGIVATGVASVAVSNKNYVTINTATGALGSDAGGTSTIVITGDTGGPLTSSSFTFTGGTTGLSFGGSGSTETLTFAGITANGGEVNIGTDTTTNAINIGVESSSGREITIGTVTGSTSLDLFVGTGNFSVDGVGASTYSIGVSTTTGTITLGGPSQTGFIKIPSFTEGALITSSSGVISTVTGTAGYVLTANSPGTAPSFQVVGAASGALILSTAVVLTSAQVKTLHATPQTILPAPGAGKFISVITAYGKMTYGGNNPFVAATADVRLYYINVSGLVIDVAASNPTITATSTSYDYSTPVGFQNQLGATIENAPIVVANPSATEISGNAAGDNTLSIIIAYTILPI